MPKLGREIRSIRKHRGETMVEFAEILGVTHASVSRYESGKGLPGYKVMLTLFDLARRIGPARVEGFRDALEISTDEKPVIDLFEALSRTPYSPKIRRAKVREIPSGVLLKFFDLAIRCSKHSQGIEFLEGALSYLEAKMAGPEGPPDKPANQDTLDLDESLFLQNMRDLYRAADPLVEEARRAAAVLRKRSKAASKPKESSRNIP